MTEDESTLYLSAISLVFVALTAFFAAQDAHFFGVISAALVVSAIWELLKKKKENLEASS